MACHQPVVNCVMFRNILFILLAALLFGCERAIYMGGPETNLLSSLDHMGDVQLAANLNVIDFQNTAQIAGEVAVTNFLGLRGHVLGGGDNLTSMGEQTGRIQGFGAGLGSFYSLSGEKVKGSSWIGVGEGWVQNVHLQEFEFSNRYNRYYFEQQLRFKVGILEFVTLGSFGISHVYRFEKQGEPLTLSNADWLASQINNPRAFYGQVGQALLIGSDNLRLTARIDWLFGPGSQQTVRFIPYVFSMGISYRLPARDRKLVGSLLRP